MDTKGHHSEPVHAPGARRLERLALRDALSRDPDFRYAYQRNHAGATPGDYLLATAADPHRPEEIFSGLRWGGQFIFVGDSAQSVSDLAGQFHQRGGFVLDLGPHACRSLLGRLLPWLRGPHYFIARRVALIPPGEVTDRFTFDVQLVREHPWDPLYVVRKQIPSHGMIVARLRRKMPELGLPEVAERAAKLVERVFPLLLTREVAFLKILGESLPPEYRDRVPHVLHTERGPDGLVQRMYSSWLRPAQRPISQLRFAMQSADLLRVLHDQVAVIHLDLRLDNFVVTDRGVGFVDFGSAVRVGEDLRESRLLRSLFDEMLSTSQIQRTLGRMKESGIVTSQFLADAHGRVDKAADVFYLAVQLCQPHGNPDLGPLIRFDPKSREAHLIRRLTRAVLRPEDPAHPRYASAASILEALRAIKVELQGGPPADLPSAAPATKHL